MARVLILKCENYQPNELKAKIEKIFSYFPQAVKPNEKILIKPNLLSAHLPEETVTTHPEFVRVVAKVIKNIGAQPTIGDSPSGIEKVEKVWEITGMKKIAQEENIELVNFTHSSVREFSSQNFPGKKIYLTDAAFEVDGIISLPKLKTHGLTTFTTGIKNLYGLVPGMIKTDYHRLAYNSQLFAQLLSEILTVVKPRLTITDGIVGMDGNGPVVGRIRNFGLILASDDVVALDTVVCEIIGLKKEFVPLLKFCEDKKLGETNLEKIEIVGEKLGDCKIRDFILPPTHLINYLPQSVASILSDFIWFRPGINQTKCELCLKCYESCPVKAIKLISSANRGRKEKKYLWIDHKECINCFCCSEVCPYGAVETEQSIPMKLVRILQSLKTRFI